MAFFIQNILSFTNFNYCDFSLSLFLSIYANLREKQKIFLKIKNDINVDVYRLQYFFHKIFFHKIFFRYTLRVHCKIWQGNRGCNAPSSFDAIRYFVIIKLWDRSTQTFHTVHIPICNQHRKSPVTRNYITCG